MKRSRPLHWLVVLGIVLAALPLMPAPAPDSGTTPATPAFNPEQATADYLARLTPAEKARSDAYWNGGYWIRLIDLVITLAVAWLLLGSGLSRRMRALAERLSKRKPLQTFIYALQYIVVLFLLTFPFTVWVDFIREHRYNLSHQPFGQWLGEQFIDLAVSAVLLSILAVAMYGVIRKKPRTWWLWGSGVMILFLMFLLLIQPVFIDPLFNRYTPMKEGPLKERILNLARANAVPARDVLQFDASRQTTRVSANVSGFLGTMRIALNDNLLNRCSPAEVAHVMAHETAHYVLNHIYESLIYFAILILAIGIFLERAFRGALRRWGRRWGVRDAGDVAGLPLLVALLVLFLFAASPLLNTIIRSNEVEADLFALNAAREPDAAATVALKLGEYRKLDPSPLEEWLFYDHPSGRIRILTAMRWKAATADANR